MKRISDKQQKFITSIRNKYSVSIPVAATPKIDKIFQMSHGDPEKFFCRVKKVQQKVYDILSEKRVAMPMFNEIALHAFDVKSASAAAKKIAAERILQRCCGNISSISYRKARKKKIKQISPLPLRNAKAKGAKVRDIVALDQLSVPELIQKNLLSEGIQFKNLAAFPQLPNTFRLFGRRLGSNKTTLSLSIKERLLRGETPVSICEGVLTKKQAHQFLQFIYWRQGGTNKAKKVNELITTINPVTFLFLLHSCSENSNLDLLLTQIRPQTLTLSRIFWERIVQNNLTYLTQINNLDEATYKFRHENFLKLVRWIVHKGFANTINIQHLDALDGQDIHSLKDSYETICKRRDLRLAKEESAPIECYAEDSKYVKVMRTKESFVRESHEMHHCIGQSNFFFDRCKQKIDICVSIRTRYGKSTACINYLADRISQHSAEYNGTPCKQNQKLLLAWMKRQRKIYQKKYGR